MIARLPHDACPYPRPFTDAFVECPLYDGEHYLPADSRESPLSPIWTCRNLLTHRFTREGAKHHYGACRFGGEKARGRLLLAGAGVSGQKC